MLQAMLLAALIAAPLGSAALFVPARLIDRGAGMWSAVRRFVLALIGTAVLAAAVALALRLLGPPSTTCWPGPRPWCSPA
jgi:hypothetical protein